jgi:hypothetical protein
VLELELDTSEIFAERSDEWPPSVGVFPPAGQISPFVEIVMPFASFFNGLGSA